jgi:hypothetical protein
VPKSALNGCIASTARPISKRVVALISRRSTRQLRP